MTLEDAITNYKEVEKYQPEHSDIIVEKTFPGDKNYKGNLSVDGLR